MDGKQVLEIYNKMRYDRGNMADLWRDVVRYCYPYEREGYDEFGGNERTPGKRRGLPVCTYPVTFAERLGSSLTNSAFPTNDNWFDFSFAGTPAFAERADLREWCRKARDLTQFKMRQGSNFYQECGALMHGLGTLGTGGFYTYYKRGELRYRYVPIHKNLYIARNSDGDIDMVAILHEWTAKEAIEEYGEDAVGEEVKRALTIGSDAVRSFRFVQLVYPKRTYGEKYDLAKGQKPYGDITVELDSGRVVAQGGHIQFPFAVPRFYVVSDDLYGRSPAMNAMPLIKALNKMRATILNGATRAIQPPVFINTLIGKPISIEAGAVNRIPNFDPNSIWTYPAQANLQSGEAQMQEMVEELKHAFLIDIFQAIDQSSRMTATEITERVRQKTEAIAPIVSRIHREFSGVVVKQSVNLLIEHGELELPDIPMGAGVYLDIKYTSAMDAMIQQGIASKTMTFAAQAGQLAQALAMAPDLNNILDTDKILQTLADCNMLPHGYLRPEQEREAMRQAQAQAQAQQAQAANAESQSAAQLNMAKAQKIMTGGGYNGLHE